MAVINTEFWQQSLWHAVRTSSKTGEMMEEKFLR